MAADIHPSVAELAAFTLGTLDDDALAAVESHVADCPACQELAADSAGDNLVEVLRRIHGQTTRQVDTVAQAHTPEPVPAAAADGTAVFDAVPQELARHERYRIVRLLGEGGMGSVFQAEHRVMQRPVAVKIINSALTSRPAAVERFRREVRAAARLAHPNIVHTYDAEDAGNTLFLVMEYVEGVSLARLVKEKGPLPVAVACDYVRQAALGLQHAHERGMIHRDVKPENLILSASPAASAPGVVKVLDFGLAALTAERDGDLTEANVVMGTPDFMAPEQAESPHGADIRADVYSLGCTLYFLLTGKVPFPAPTSLLKIIAHREQPLPAVGKARPEVPLDLARIVARLLAKKPEDRFQTPGEVAAALEAFAADEQTRRHGVAKPRRKHGWIVAAALLFLGLVAAGAVYRVQTDKGDLVITTESEDVEVVIKQGGKVIHVIDTKTDRRITLRSGVYDLELRGAKGLKLTLDKATLTRGVTVLANIERVAKPAPEAFGEVFRKRWDHLPVTSGVDLSPDGRLLISMHWGGVRVWEVATGKVVHEWGGWLGRFTPDGKKIVITIPPDENKNQLQLYETASGKLLRQFGPHPHSFGAMAMCQDGNTVITGGDDRVNRQWDMTTGKLVKTAPLGVWTDPKKIWESKEVPEFAKRTGIIPEYVLPGDREVMGRNLVDGRFVPIYEIASGRLVRKIALVKSGQVEVIGVAASYGRRFGKRMAFALADGTIVVLDLVAGTEVCRFSAGIFQPKALAISADDRFVAACAFNEKSDVVVWRLPDPPAVEDKP